MNVPSRVTVRVEIHGRVQGVVPRMDGTRGFWLAVSADGCVIVVMGLSRRCSRARQKSSMR